MIPVKQTIFGNYHGNCFAACIASILELPLETIPNFCVLSNYESLGESEWFDAFLFWLSDRGFSYLEFLPGYLKLTDEQLCILSGKSPRGDFRHCVVGQFGEEQVHVVHDPHPSDDGIDGEFDRIGVFIPIDPVARFSRKLDLGLMTGRSGDVLSWDSSFGEYKWKSTKTP